MSGTRVQEASSNSSDSREFPNILGSPETGGQRIIEVQGAGRGEVGAECFSVAFSLGSLCFIMCSSLDSPGFLFGKREKSSRRAKGGGQRCCGWVLSSSKGAAAFFAIDRMDSNMAQQDTRSHLLAGWVPIRAREAAAAAAAAAAAPATHRAPTFAGFVPRQQEQHPVVGSTVT